MFYLTICATIVLSSTISFGLNRSRLWVLGVLSVDDAFREDLSRFWEEKALERWLMFWDWLNGPTITCFFYWPPANPLLEARIIGGLFPRSCSISCRSSSADMLSMSERWLLEPPPSDFFCSDFITVALVIFWPIRLLLPVAEDAPRPWVCGGCLRPSLP